VVGDANSDGSLLRVGQPSRHLFGRRQDERVRPGCGRLDGAEGSVVQDHELAELREVGADQGEVVPFVEAAQLSDALRAPCAAEAAPQRVAGVGRVGHQGVVLGDHGRYLRHGARLGVSRVNIEVAGHDPRLEGSGDLSGQPAWVARRFAALGRTRLHTFA